MGDTSSATTPQQPGPWPTDEQVEVAYAANSEPGIYWPPPNDNDTSARTATGQSTITMQDGTVWVVGHSRSEVIAKSAYPATTPGSNLVAFDLAMPSTVTNTVVLDVNTIATIV